ncbi:Histidine kinase [Catalinimonas alkaloidigena]|uniref:Histidine kinase n=1 Tax=Catalinimonas alkaloidigena TaxID=1075417 RepID=A0A1G9H489_9BACT|nr:Histidine kinase [Catalinimonas alkaloidigena]
MARSPISGYQAYLSFAAWWVLIAAFQAYGLRAFGWEVAIADGGVSSALLAVACLLINKNMRYYGPRRNQFVYMLGWCLMLDVLWLVASYRILYGLYNQEKAFTDFLWQTLPIRFEIALLILGCMAMMVALWQSHEEQKRHEQRKTDAEKLAREAELFKLHQQMQPHFLFNSLNSVIALVGSRPEEARKMLHQLSDFLRGTLRPREVEWVTLADELQHLQLYLEIEKVRFGHRLATCLDYDEAAASAQLPPMLLQPLLENAIKFGLYDTLGVVTISLRAEVQDGMLRVTVQNPFDPQTARPRQGTGFGLGGVKRRLYLLFGRHDLLETQVHAPTDAAPAPPDELVLDLDGEPAFAEQHLFTTLLKIPQL